MELDKIRGMKGCKNCPGFLEYLARDLEWTAQNRFKMGEKDWERAWEKAVGVRMAIGLLRYGVAENGDVHAELPPPPNMSPEKWAGGDRFFRSSFTDRAEDIPTNPEGKASATLPTFGPKRKRKAQKQGTAKKGMQILSLKDLKKRRD